MASFETFSSKKTSFSILVTKLSKAPSLHKFASIPRRHSISDISIRRRRTLNTCLHYESTDIRSFRPLPQRHRRQVDLRRPRVRPGSKGPLRFPGF